MLNWIILQKDYGQLGNRLHTHANLLAYCLNNRINIINFSFSQYANFFEGKTHNSSDRLIFKHDWFSYALKYSFIENLFNKLSRSDKWLKKLFPCVEVLTFKDNSVITSLSISKVFIQNSSCRFLILKGWDISCPDEIQSHHNELRSFLKPTLLYNQNSHSVIDNLRFKFDIIVGVHARRGDYKYYLNGVFFYSWKQYFEWIRQALELFHSESNSSICFLVCSDESSPTDLMKGLPVYQVNHFNPIEDLHSLSLCDYLMGPPSSFGTWASWYGQTPRFVLEEGISITKREQFKHTPYC